MFYTYLLLLSLFSATDADASKVKKTKFHPKPMTYTDRVRKDVIAENINPKSLMRLGIREYDRTGNRYNHYFKTLEKILDLPKGAISLSINSRGRL